VKTGDLVKHIPDPSALFKWEKAKRNSVKTSPGIILREIGEPFSRCVDSRRFVVAWNSGEVTEEWINRLTRLDNSLTT
jgi:hypothetical protein